MNIRPLYFGCGSREAGHYVWDLNGRRLSSFTDDLVVLFLYTHDGDFAPSETRYARHCDGKAMVHYREGFTLLSFWDGSIDSRPGSNSTFLLPGRLAIEEAISEARKLFPDVWSRFTFPVVPFLGVESEENTGVSHS